MDLPKVRIYDPATGVGNKISPEGALLTTSGMSLPAYDYMGVSQTDTTDIYTYKTGGSGGTTVATMTITYIDSTKVTIQSISKT